MVSNRSSSRGSELWSNNERLYILEGIITVVWAAMCIFLVPKDYQTAYFLNDEDKEIMKHRAELSESYSGGSGHYTMKDIKEAAKDPKSWGHAVIQIAVVTILYGEFNLNPQFYALANFSISGFGTFLPLIIKNGFHYSTVQAQYFVIPGMFTFNIPTLFTRTDQEQSTFGAPSSTQLAPISPTNTTPASSQW
jgi:hypothetical protein